MKTPTLALLPLFVLAAPLLGCEGGPVPVDIVVRDGITTGGSFGELQLVVKTLPGTVVTYDGQSKDTGDKGEETFTIPKAKLKIGANTFVVEASRGSLVSKASTSATTTWIATPKNLLRVHAPASGDFEGELSCGGLMCAGAPLKITKEGVLPLEIESVATATASIDGQKVGLTPDKRAAVSVDLTKKLGAMAVLKEEVSLPVALEGDAPSTAALDVSGPAITSIAARTLGAADKGSVVFTGEPSAIPGAKPDLLVVIGAPASKLVVVGKPGNYQDVDLVGVAKIAERFFGCGAAQGGPGILYRDLEIKVYDRRTGAAVASRKLLADRVACPPTPAGIVKGDVREDDIKRVLGELLAK